jgi:hypothetical protein
MPILPLTVTDARKLATPSCPREARL